jgi:YfiR/HmsC-like
VHRAKPKSAHLDPPRRSRRWWLVPLITALLTQACAGPRNARPDVQVTLPAAVTHARSENMPTPADRVKASYLYSFLQFVEWPPEALGGDTILVCVFGEDNFGAALREIVGETVRGRAIAVRQFSEPEGLEACHVVFVSASERSREPRVLRRLAGRPVLTVGETAGFIEHGGAINLVRVADQIRFEINQQAAEHNHLKINAQLLQLGIRR